MTKTKTTKNTKARKATTRTKTRKAKITKRVAIYLRGHSEESIALQRAHCMAYVAEHPSWVVTAEYCDHGPARDERHPNTYRHYEWDHMMRDADAEAFDIMVTYSVGRITRSLDTLASLLNRRDFAQKVFLAHPGIPLIQH